MSRPKCIGRNHPSRLYTALHPKGSQHTSQQTLRDGIHHPALKRGRILPGWSTAAVKRGFMPMAAEGEIVPQPLQNCRRSVEGMIPTSRSELGISACCWVPSRSSYWSFSSRLRSGRLRPAVAGAGGTSAPAIDKKCCIFLQLLDFSCLKQIG